MLAPLYSVRTTVLCQDHCTVLAPLYSVSTTVQRGGHHGGPGRPGDEMRGGRERDFCSRRITVNALLSMAKPEEIKCICCICTHTHTERERERERERGRAGGREGDVCVLDRTSKLSRVVEGCVGEIDWLPVQSYDAVSHSDGIVTQPWRFLCKMKAFLCI